MQQVSSRTTFQHAVMLVLGFSTVFTLLGASVGLLGGYFLYDILPIIVRAGSILLIVFALRVAHLQFDYIRWAIAAVAVGAMTYWLDRFQFSQSQRFINAVLIGLTVLAGAGWNRWVLLGLAVVVGVLSWFTSGSQALILRGIETLLVVGIVYFGNRTDILDRELRISLGDRFGRVSYWRSFLVGIIFAAGWTPCIGPILSGILLLASQTQTVAQGALLLATYSAGLAIPFLIAGALFSRLMVYLPRFYRYLPTISLVSGLLLLLIGLLIFTDSLARLAQYGFLANIEEGLLGAGTSEASLLLAFAAGLISFFSPCVLPLVPAYLGYLSGAALEGNSAAAAQPAPA